MSRSVSFGFKPSLDIEFVSTDIGAISISDSSYSAGPFLCLVL